jgi:catechol 2,3-dioxygenase-like lactoylglutathione lyase family enzyme
MIKEANLTIMVKDMDRSVSFYEALGFTLKNRWGNHYAQLTAPGVVIGLHPSGATNPAGNSGNVSIGFTATDLEAAKAVLAKMDVKTETRTEAGGKFIHFSDPDGTALYFIEPKG